MLNKVKYIQYLILYGKIIVSIYVYTIVCILMLPHMRYEHDCNLSTSVVEARL